MIHHSLNQNGENKLPTRIAALLFLTLLTLPCIAQHESASAPHFAAGIKLSLLGIGGEAAIPITSKMDIRGGFNAFSYSRNFNKDGVAYAGHLNFRSAEAHY